MAAQTISPSERIRELSAINSDAATLPTHAGLAINALTNRPLTSADNDTQMSDTSSATVEARKAAFTDHTKSFVENLQAVSARLRRQAIALEEAGIITSDNSNLGTSIPRAMPRPVGAPQPGPSAKPAGAPSQAARNEPDRITNGGLGKFDVASLNSRGNKVGEEKEAELMQEAKELLESALERMNNGA
ncbi:hypothetical protein CLAFUW4_13165 [Fulvia fulva]|uniref:Mediator of RNA polymerase II transcription subunit 11 n=1 Tax=Passalora fulva TaxID=5499 RepID=A0A9Q8PK86_PASFU|nr:uncharacterized protein CLAFUR5_13022 [Fulvia fulva]KAK4611638.1 hypothetical protein CLAFUR4_13170 [Fulvia fulva]UJO23960.1 hypothetical protein CLAFUR5_13022 [Fulvia fulva]WPV20882.1 hypothetical protein CLAFUW4_13165 [Fulvia fulva]WPV36098.1 hypothetical protein CLAFUW7_13173 [Fulvia fulva]